MKYQRPQIGHAIQIGVTWYDNVPEPQKTTYYEGEIIGWRKAQVIVRVKDYAVVRFWKKSGLEVGNPDHHRRGMAIDLDALKESLKATPAGVNVELSLDGTMPALPQDP